MPDRHPDRTDPAAEIAALEARLAVTDCHGCRADFRARARRLRDRAGLPPAGCQL